MNKRNGPRTIKQMLEQNKRMEKDLYTLLAKFNDLAKVARELCETHGIKLTKQMRDELETLVDEHYTDKPRTEYNKPIMGVDYGKEDDFSYQILVVDDPKKSDSPEIVRFEGFIIGDTNDNGDFVKVGKVIAGRSYDESVEEIVTQPRNSKERIHADLVNGQYVPGS